MALKICPKCKKIKTTKHFYKNKITEDGLQTYCKSCTIEANKKTRDKREKPLLDDNFVIGKYRYF